jgi:hypothetical protein
MLPQVLLGLLRIELLRCAVVPSRIRAMADFSGLVPAVVLITMLSGVASLSCLCYAKETEHGGESAARGEPQRLAAGPGFARDRFCQLIEASAVHV